MNTLAANPTMDIAEFGYAPSLEDLLIAEAFKRTTFRELRPTFATLRGRLRGKIDDEFIASLDDIREWGNPDEDEVDG